MTRVGIRRLELLILRGGRWVLLLVALAGVLSMGMGAWTYQHPPTTTVTDHQNQQTVDSTLETSAVVTPNSSLFESGTVVSDPPVFLRETMPTVTLRRTTTVPAGHPVQVTQELTLVTRVTSEGETLWTNRTTLHHAETTTESGHMITQSRVDVNAVANRLADVRDEVGSAGSVHAAVRTNITYHTDSYEGQLTDTAALTIGDTWYQVESPDSSRSHSTPVDRTVEVPFASPLPYAGPIGLGIVLLSFAGWGVYLHYRDISLSTLERRIHQERYDEWISNASIPWGAAENAIAVDTVEGLVDIGIDTGKRVVHDADRGLYLVIDDTARYCHRVGNSDPGTTDDPPSGWESVHVVERE